MSVKLRGALAAIQRKVALNAFSVNEFPDSRPPTFQASERIVPSAPYADVIHKILEIRIATNYAHVKGDSGEAMRMTEDNAMRELCSFLYEDVIHDLQVIMRELGAGKRHSAMTLVSALTHRLAGPDY